jgi:ribosomal protein S18 acetylase RimI-like enzyme
VIVEFCFSPSLIPYSSASTNGNIGASSLIIRKAETKDIKKLAEVLTHSFHPPERLFYWIQPLLKLGISEDLRTRLRGNSPHYRCLVASQLVTTVAENKEEIVGTVEIALRAASILGNHYPYISNLAVNHAYRRQGIARKLLLKCEQIASAWGFEELSLHVLEDNHQAKQLYLTSGYQIHRIESSWSSVLFKSPRRLFLNKKMPRFKRSEFIQKI